MLDSSRNGPTKNGDVHLFSIFVDMVRDKAVWRYVVRVSGIVLWDLWCCVEIRQLQWVSNTVRDQCLSPACEFCGILQRWIVLKWLKGLHWFWKGLPLIRAIFILWGILKVKVFLY